ncbi:MAG: CaiB/BaiF CoA transferase family protein [Candidatus Hodarchaeales archaeon]
MKDDYPLEGIKVVDISRVLTGPFACQILGDLGATVWKVEPPQGDETRGWGPPFLDEEQGISAYFASVNRNKKSICIDLKKLGGLKILQDLVSIADIFIENFRPGVVERLKISYSDLKEINDKLIYVSISGFGQTGPWKNLPGYDIIAQAETGLMSITGSKSGGPSRVGVAVADIAAANWAVTGILSALYRREKTGYGDYLDISLLDSLFSWMTYQAANYFATGIPPGLMGTAHPNIVPYQAFKTADRKEIVIAVPNDSIWTEFCKVIGKLAWTRDPRYTSNSLREKNRDELIRKISSVLVEEPADYWIEAFRKSGVPAGEIRDLAEATRLPQLEDREMIFSGKLSSGVDFKTINQPIHFLDANLPVMSPPPEKGKNTREIMEMLGYSTYTINDYYSKRVIY